MSNPNKARGTRFETAIVDYLRDVGFPTARRLPLVGAKDVGDIRIDARLDVIEAKDHKTMALGVWMNEAEKEAKNTGKAGVRYAVVHKRRGKAVDEAYVTMPLWAYAQLLKRGLHDS